MSVTKEQLESEGYIQPYGDNKFRATRKGIEEAMQGGEIATAIADSIS